MFSRGRIKPMLAAIVAAAGVAVVGVYMPVSAQGPDSHPNPYSRIDDFFKLPGARTIGSTAGMDLDRDGRSVWFFERCGASDCVGSSVAPILKFDSSGNLVTSFGAGMFASPHGVHVDRDGNIWVTDAGEGEGKGHQVFKFSPDGKLLMTLGRAGVAGDGPDTFNRPTDVLVAPNGEFFVSDGHGGDSNARIVKFSKEGTFIKTWGRKGSGPGEFDTPHALVMDSSGRLFVGDRGNSRIQIFDQEGTFLEEWRQFGRPSGLFIDRNDMLYSADHQSNETTNPGGWQKGIWIGSAKDGQIEAFVPDAPDGSQEGIAADVDGNLYTSFTGGMALKKYVKK